MPKGVSRSDGIRRLLVVLVVGAVCVLAMGVRGQSTMSMTIFNDASTFSPELTQSDLDVFKRVLSLKAAEAAAMEELYSSYCSTLKTEGSAVRAFVSEVQEESELMADQRLLKPAQEKLSVWEKRSEQLKKSFMEDLKALLTRDQESRWPIVERELRRLKRLGGGRIPGEQVDLVKLVEGLPQEAKKSAQLNDLLERYSQDLDRAIVSRGDYIDKYGKDFEELIDSDPQKAQSVFDRATKERVALADVNARYLRLIQAEVPPDAAAGLEEKVFRLSYPQLSKQTKGERWITAAGKLPDLNADPRPQVKQIIEEYDRAKQANVKQMAEHVRDDKLKQLPERLAKKLGIAPPGKTDEGWQPRGLPEDHPLTKLRRVRFELDKSTRVKLEGILTAEQRTKLPDLAAEAVTFVEDTPWGL